MLDLIGVQDVFEFVQTSFSVTQAIELLDTIYEIEITLDREDGKVFI